MSKRFLLLVWLCLFALSLSQFLKAEEMPAGTGAPKRQFPGGADEEDLQVQKSPPPHWDRFNLRETQDQEIKSAMSSPNRGTDSDEEAAPEDRQPKSDAGSESAGE